MYMPLVSLVIRATILRIIITIQSALPANAIGKYHPPFILALHHDFKLLKAESHSLSPRPPHTTENCDDALIHKFDHTNITYSHYNPPFDILCIYKTHDILFTLLYVLSWTC